MSKAYSNKALPPGTVLREWRLEEVLGVGGFGIVYRARGIYFDELVAIKEYFPSSISERDEEDTVVPIDSDAEEVHALGLKKFVEEAKLLWNLSTPSRHPNIVSVRSLFEIHGTAYMVMDFEDGISLSKLLKQGRRFNERSLLAIIKPIAEGLERAHRVGVLHRDIKPANILINDSGRPVLIDFGSARFEAAEATSTKVTFHTPPYAALEQYVKTFEQGPWTDIYALGVVLHECVTGEKPPEVLERMHGGQDQPLAGGRWPGYSERFLAAVDAAMAIRPADRPQSISDWLALLDGTEGTHSSTIETDEDATRVAPFDMAAEQIVPVPPPTTGAPKGKALETGVPASTRDAKFKRAGHETGAARKVATAGAAVATRSRSKKAVAPAEPVGPAAAVMEKERPHAPVLETAAVAEPKPAAEKKEPAKPANDTGKRKLSPALVAGGALGLVVLAGGGWMLTRDSGQDVLPESAALATLPEGAPAEIPADLATWPGSVQQLAENARTAGVPATLVQPLGATGEELTGLQQQLQPLLTDPQQSAQAVQIAQRMAQLTQAGSTAFAAGLLQETEQAGRRLGTDVPWAAPGGSARGLTGERQQTAGTIREAMAALRAAAQPEQPAADATAALAAAREALSQWQRFNAGVTTAYRLQAVPVAERPERQASLEPTTAPTAPRATAAPAATAAAAAPARTAAAETSSETSLSPAKISRLNGIVDDGRSMARDVIRMGERSRAGSTAEERAAHALRRSNAQLARGYDSYLAKLRDSARGVTTDREADRLIKDATQTRAYIQFLVKRSTESLSQ